MQKLSCIPLEDLTDEQIELRTFASSMLSYWIFPAVLRVEGSPERAASYLLQVIEAVTDDHPPVSDSVYGHIEHVRALSQAAFEISKFPVETD